MKDNDDDGDGGDYSPNVFCDLPTRQKRSSRGMKWSISLSKSPPDLTSFHITACDNCRKTRSKCDRFSEGGPCAKCAKSKTSMHIHHQAWGSGLIRGLRV